MTRNILNIILVVLLAVGLAGVANASTATWTGNGSTDAWSDSGNWSGLSGDAYPGQNNIYDVVMNPGAVDTCSLDVTVSVNDLTIGSLMTLTVKDAKTLTITSSNLLDCDGKVYIERGGVFQLPGTSGTPHTIDGQIVLKASGSTTADSTLKLTGSCTLSTESDGEIVGETPAAVIKDSGASPRRQLTRS